jgi:hypothetical protein
MMNEPSKRDRLSVELEKERSVRRTVRLLQAKRSRVREELERLITHLGLLVASPQNTTNDYPSKSDILLEAVSRIEDDVFTELLVQIIENKKKYLSGD